jgi:hypothetical protein
MTPSGHAKGWCDDVTSGEGVVAVEVSTIPKQLDLRVQDRDALDEIELYTDVLGAVAASDGPLSRDEIDEVLGVTPDDL